MQFVPLDFASTTHSLHVVAIAAILGAIFSMPARRPASIPLAFLISAGLSLGIVQMALNAPLSLGPEAHWMGLAAAGAGALLSSRNPVWAMVAIAQSFLPVWAGWGPLNLLTVGFCAWRHVMGSDEGGLKVSQLGALIGLQVLLLLAPAIEGRAGMLGFAWGFGTLALWMTITGSRYGLANTARRITAVATFAVACMGFIYMALTGFGSLGNQLLILIPAIVVAEAAGRPLLPGWWFLVLPGMLFAGYQTAPTTSEIVLLLALVAALTAILRASSPEQGALREEGAKVRP